MDKWQWMNCSRFNILKFCYKTEAIYLCNYIWRSAVMIMVMMAMITMMMLVTMMIMMLIMMMMMMMTMMIAEMVKVEMVTEGKQRHCFYMLRLYLTRWALDSGRP